MGVETLWDLMTGAGIEPAACGLKEPGQLVLTRATSCYLSTTCPDRKTSRTEYHKPSRAVSRASPTVRPTISPALPSTSLAVSLDRFALAIT